MSNQELVSVGDITKARIGVYNIEVTNNGTKIKVFRRRIFGKELIFENEVKL